MILLEDFNTLMNLPCICVGAIVSANEPMTTQKKTAMTVPACVYPHMVSVIPNQKAKAT